MNDTPTTIILCGGQINYSNLPVGMTQSNAMIPVNGKPVIGWILDDLLAKGITQATVVLREQDQRFKAFLQRAYTRRMDLSIAALRQEGTILQSLQAGLRCSPSSGTIRLILGDTLIRDSYEFEENFVYVGKVDDSHRWCLALTTPEGEIFDFIDKQVVTVDPKLALAGYYHFQHGDHLIESVEHSIGSGERELSDVLRRYGAVYPLHVKLVDEWYDFGNLDNLVDARRRLLQPRYFNSLTINPVFNTITKVSENNKKLQDELDWYLNLPDELKVLAPRIISHEALNGQIRVVQEYYGYPTLAELYVYSDLNADAWVSVLRHVLRIHQGFQEYPGHLDPADIRSIYVDKTWERLDELKTQSPAWKALLEAETLHYNGRPLRNIYNLQAAINARADQLAENAPVNVIHGDFCFSNILFEVNSHIIRLIDPRGSFGKKGIYGDSRYDIAKLRHSACSFYDYIIADMFEVAQGDDDMSFKGQVYVNGKPRVVAAAFDRMITEFGYDLDDIRFIEALLFISMVPLHHGHLQRQQMMYLTGLSLLNEVL